MAKTLIVAEKPSVAMNIASALGERFERNNGFLSGNRYIVSWCVGHLVGLAMPEVYLGDKDKWNFDSLPIIPEQWKLTVFHETKDQYKILVSLMKNSNVDNIVCATDAGREGELIFRYVYKTSGSKKPVQRLWVSSMEKSAILDGLSSMKPDSDYDRLFDAGFSRARADWLIGMNATKLFTVRYGTFISIGRVQTPTLAAIVRREKQISNFKSEPFYTVEITKNDTVLGVSARIDDKKKAEDLRSAVANKDATVTKVIKETKKSNPPKLFDLTTLQRQANKLFGYTASKTLDYTQSLYEKKYVTYPRTDSSYITTDMKESVTNLYKALKDASFIKDNGVDIPSEPDVKRVTNDKKVSDHHAIIPTKEVLSFKSLDDLDELSIGERIILLLIIERFICAMGSTASFELTKVELDVEGNKFNGKGVKGIDEGYTRTLSELQEIFFSMEPKNVEKKLPDLFEGQVIKEVKAQLKEGETKPPKHFTEDTLLAFMETAGNEDYDENSDAEKKGIGTPATRASIIEKLVDRRFIKRAGKNLLPTPDGEAVVEVVPEILKSAKLTADWEMKLKEVEKGDLQASEFMDQIQTFTRDLVKEYAQKALGNFQNNSNQKIGRCPRCQGEVVNGKFGPYCYNRCGMNLTKVRGKKLTDKQLQSLLSGKSISITVDGNKYEVLPSYEDYTFKSKDGKTIKAASFVSRFIYTRK